MTDMSINVKPYNECTQDERVARCTAEARSLWCAVHPGEPVPPGTCHQDHFGNWWIINTEGTIHAAEERILASIQQQHERERTARLAPLSIDAFADSIVEHEFLIDDVLVAGQPMLISGPGKCMKTTIALEMAISLACGPGCKFLGRFEIRRQCKVGFWSAESGGSTLLETLERILRAKHRNKNECQLMLSSEIPSIDMDADTNDFGKVLVDNEITVAFIDPLGMALGGAAEHLANSHVISQRLHTFAGACTRAGCMPVLLDHHSMSASKNKHGREAYGMPDITHMAYGGARNWMRQWLQVNRRSAYKFDGKHGLWMSVGGSAGHSGGYKVDIEEGVLKPGSRRHWHVEVSDLDIVNEEGIARQQENTLASNLEMLRQAIENGGREGVTRAELRMITGIGQRRMDTLFGQLQRAGSVVIRGSKNKSPIWMSSRFVEEEENAVRFEG